ncbi:MAG: SDR family NAD(P)-dependent oxidoreductase [Anaerolineae bacterium]|jgi:NAD(P)-dependent dehydrogenase (short-subunit alcohol dehydrogenase family)
MVQNAMVWGAGGGIGQALVSILSQEGWRVIALGRGVADLSNLASDVIEVNVADEGAVQRAVEAAKKELDQVDLWVYSVGDIAASKVADAQFDSWQRILDANLTGAYLTTHYSLPLLARDAHMIFLGAISERLRLPRLSAYASAKAGLEAFVEVLGKEERKRRVTLVRPAAVDTPLWDKVPFNLPAKALSPEDAAQRILAAHRDNQRGVLDL